MIGFRILPIAAITAMAAWAVTPRTDKLPMFFVGNHGQAPRVVLFMAKASWLNAYFLRGEVRFALADASVRVQFEGADLRRDPQGVGPLPGRANFLVGTEDHWRLGVPMYGAVAYRSLYPGIDMIYGGNGRELKSEFVVRAGADPSQIRLRYSGSGAVGIDAQGRLVIPAGDRELREDAPTIYQEKEGARSAVEGRYSLTPDGAVSFVLGEYDRTQTLVIDPVLSYSTLLGGTNSNAVTGLAVDASGDVYVAGSTASYDFPVSGAFQNSTGGGNDAFVAKLNSSGNGLVYCTYLGGSGDDRAYGIAVDGSGSALITGSTTSPNFPVHSPLQGKLAGARNAFVSKLNPAGNGLVYSTYLGGNGSDFGYGVAVDGSGNAYVVGDTTSSNFPASGLQPTNKGVQDAFVAKVSADGSHLLYSTYLGGSSIDHGAAIAVDASGSAYVTGSTYSTDFPTANAWQPSNAGGQDIFVSRLSADGSALLFSTYLGGTGGTVAYPESGMAIDVDTSGNAYVTGVTSSTNFPLLNPLQSLLMGTTDAFVAKLTSSGTLSYSTYLGGSGQDVGTAIAVDGGGNAYVAGYGYSTDLPVTANALQTTNAGAYDAFVAILNPAGNSLMYLSYLGGNGSDAAAALALDPLNNIYVAGWTLSTNFPVVNANQATNPGNYAAFITKISFPTMLSAVSVTPNSGSGASQTFSFQFSDLSGASDLATVSTLVNSTTSLSSACAVTYNPAQNSLALMTDAGTLPSASMMPGNGSQQNSQCTLSGSGSSVTIAGTQLTLNLALTFTGAFQGTQNIYLYAQSAAGATTGWQPRGAWTVPAGAPTVTAVAVSPSSGGGTSQTFQLKYSDSAGAASIATAAVFFGASLSGFTSACDVVYTAQANAVNLLNDAGTGWSASATPGSNVILENSQCSVNLATTSVSQAANTLTLNMAMGFTTAFSGSKNVYLYGQDVGETNSGWQQLGAWTVQASSIWSSSAVPQNPFYSSPPATVGVKFRSDVSGSITALRFYKGAGNNGTHIGLLYNASGSLLAQATYTGETSSGWQQVNLSTPVTIAPNTTYVVAYFSTSGFAYNASYFTNNGVDNPPLHALKYGVDGPNGVYLYASSAQFPTYDGWDQNYWADVVFSSTTSPPSTPDMTIASNHTGSFTQGQTGATYSITAGNGGTGPTSGTVTVTETVPAGLTATSIQGSGWTCTQPAGPCTRGDVLAAGTNYPAITVTVNVSSTAPASVTNAVTVSGGGETNTANDQAADPTTIQASGSSGTATSIWSSSAVPQNPLYSAAPVTLGVKFRSDVSGSITALRFYKGAGNNGTHTGMLYTSNGTLLAKVTYTGETASGWQQMNLPTPVTIVANTTYVVAYFSTTGFAYDASYFANTGVDNPPLHALKYGVDGPNGIYLYASVPTFPGNDGYSQNYWADVVFSPGS
jgi:hypothetical protein